MGAEQEATRGRRRQAVKRGRNRVLKTSRRRRQERGPARVRATRKKDRTALLCHEDGARDMWVNEGGMAIVEGGVDVGGGDVEME